MNVCRWSLAAVVAATFLLGRLSMAEDAKPAALAVEKGNALFEKGDLDAAIAAFTEAIRLDPKSVMAYLGRGIAYSKKANSKMPDFAKPGVEQGEAMTIYEQTTKKAMADYEQAIRINKKEVEAYVARRVAADKQLEVMGPHNDLMSLQNTRSRSRIFTTWKQT